PRSAGVRARGGPAPRRAPRARAGALRAGARRDRALLRAPPAPARAGPPRPPRPGHGPAHPRDRGPPRRLYRRRVRPHDGRTRRGAVRAMSVEHRKHPRYAVEVAAELTLGARTLAAATQNV